jgi:hypothetical protein
MYKDVNVMEISSDDQSNSQPKNKRNPTTDIEQFFEPAKHVKGDKRGRCQCKACMYVINSLSFVDISSFCRSGDGGCSKADRVLVDEHSTLRRHLASLHKVRNKILMLAKLNFETSRVYTNAGASLPASYQCSQMMQKQDVKKSLREPWSKHKSTTIST